MIFFFFKQKTAYEMRISDWSSDVCSSDLERRLHPDDRGAPRPRLPSALDAAEGGGRDLSRFLRRVVRRARRGVLRRERAARGTGQIGRATCRERVCQYV